MTRNLRRSNGMALPVRIAPSILAADFSNLARDIARVEKAGADMIHVDVMDGHFVNNLTIGSCVVKDIRKATRLPLDVHLMIEEPSRYLDDFIRAGSDIITVHAESRGRTGRLLSRIRDSGRRAGISVRPRTDIKKVSRYLDCVDMVLIMTVEPGFGGQAFMEDMLPKIAWLRRRYKGDIQVDGGINESTAPLVVGKGANVLVAGTAVFGARDLRRAIRAIKKA